MSGRAGQDKRRPDFWPGQIALAYCIVSLFWIFGSGYIVSALTSGVTSSIVEVGKGTGFVLVTSGGLYVVLARRARSIRLADEARAVADEERIRLATAVEQAAEAIVITDPQGQMIYVNPAFEKVSGYSKTELLDRSPKILADADNTEVLAWPELNDSEVWRGTLGCVRRDGEPYEVETVISPIRNSEGKLVCHVAVERDVTQERAFERELAEAARMEAVGQLAGGIAHDFNNQLTAIRGYAELVRADVGSDPRAVADVDEILRASRSAAQLVKQLLALARRQVLEPSSLSLSDLLDQLQPMLRGLVGPRTELEIRPVGHVAPVWADAGQIEQVLVNLTVNAHDAMPNGGRLVISLSNVEIAPDSQWAARIEPGRYVLLTAADSGIGMDEATLARAFEPFFTTKAPGRGTGLGLSSAYGIIKQSGGFLTVDSEVGVGTIFRIYLPQYDGPAAERVSALGVEPVAGGSETILLVEDEPALRELARQSLEKLGYRLLIGREATEAMTLADNEGRLPLLVTDIRLPSLDGPSLAKVLRERNPGLRVLYVSGYAGDAMVNSGLLRPDEAFLPKPFTGDELARHIRQLLDAEAVG